MNRFSKFLSILLTLVLLLSLCSCERVEQLLPPPAETTVRPRVTVTPVPTLNNAPALLYKGVSTDQRVISLVFEGFTDAGSMNSLVTLLSQRNTDCVFFLSGATADDYPQTVKAIADAGFEIGNYGITAKKRMEEAAIPSNMHQFTRTQELLREACGVTPELFRCNETEYTREILQAAAARGLKAGVEPTHFLNHRSFSEADDADVYVQRLYRGAILSVKLGQELSLDEYAQGTWTNNEKPANDPSPGISDVTDEMETYAYSNIVPMVTWLLDALEAAGYIIVSPEQLQGYAIDMLGSPRELSEDELQALDTAQYELPVTQQALSAGQFRQGMAADLEGSVFVGDSITAGLQDYVLWRRQTEPDFLSGVEFLTDDRLSVEAALTIPGPSTYHPEYNELKTTIENQLALMDAKRVYLMLRLNDSRAYASDVYLENYKLLIYLIKEKNPDIEICILSLPPSTGTRNQQPTNMQLFRFNLFMYKLCLQYDLYFIDVAYTLRTDTGALRTDYCIDVSTTGTHLSDAGCNVLLDYLLRHIPALPASSQGEAIS